MSQILDNPVWHALTGPNATFAVGSGLARHFPRDMAPFSAIAAATPAAYADLAVGLPMDTEARLFRLFDEPPPEGWVAIDAFPMLQMVAGETSPGRSGELTPVCLTAADIGQMMELAAIAKPGPFGALTPRFGTYLGIREGNRLIAMAGERMRVPGFVELSAICTHPDARGRSLAAHLTALLMQAARDRGEVPFLHVRPENKAAVLLYQRLGFAVRRTIWILWRKPMAQPA